MSAPRSSCPLACVRPRPEAGTPSLVPQHRQAPRPNGEPDLRAAFSRAARRHLAVPLMLGGVCCTRKRNSAVRNNAPRLDLTGSPIGTVILSYNAQDCKSFLQKPPPHFSRRLPADDAGQPLSRCASASTAINRRRGRAVTGRRERFSASRAAIRSRNPLVASSISAGRVTLGDVLRAVDVPGVDGEQDRALGPGAVAGIDQPLHQRRIVLDHAGAAPDLDPLAVGEIEQEQDRRGRCRPDC